MKKQMKAAWQLAPVAVRESFAQWQAGTLQLTGMVHSDIVDMFCHIAQRPRYFIRLSRANTREDLLVQGLFSEIRTLQVQNPLILDIGANIGLIGLSILAEFPTAKVIAFEPAPFQRRILQKTVKANSLQRRISVESIALGNQSGRASFAVHKSIDTSGSDGFLDTGVGGPAKQIKVRVSTLDKWWSRNGNPFISIIKMDTEGSELMVLHGAEAVLRECRPTLFLEIWPEHLKHYSITVHHIISWLRSQNYELVTLSGRRLDVGNAGRYLGVETNLSRGWELQSNDSKRSCIVTGRECYGG